MSSPDMSVGAESRSLLEVDVAVASCVVEFLDDSRHRSLEESTFDVAQRVLKQAIMTFANVDAVVISGIDQMDGRVIESMVLSGAAGGVGRDLTCIPSASEHALLHAYQRIQAGFDSATLVLAFCKPSEGVVPEHAELVSAEPFFLRPIGFNNTIAAALQASALNELSDVDGAGKGPGDKRKVVAWPLYSGDLPRSRDLVVGMVLGERSTFTGQRPLAWIDGVGWATDEYELASRSGTFNAMSAAADRAYAQAGVSDPESQIELAVVQSVSAAATPFLVEALRLDQSVLSKTDPALAHAHGGHAAGLMALARAAIVLGQVETPPDPLRVKLSVGAAVHGFGGQGSTVVVFGDRPASECT
jgi:hypothetical protein